MVVGDGAVHVSCRSSSSVLLSGAEGQQSLTGDWKYGCSGIHAGRSVQHFALSLHVITVEFELEYVAPLRSTALIFNFLFAKFLVDTPVTANDV